MIELKFIIMICCSIGMVAKFRPSMYLGHHVVRIEGGKIVGATFEDFYAFKGIPYAEPPIGKLRFSPPKPYSESWIGVREFKNFSAVCAQYDHFGYRFEGSEDCLTLNVYVPKLVVEKNLKVPVIFFIHGGAFMYGGGNVYGPENLMRSQNMILVTINYRLGILGFLSTEDEVIPGNFGLKDQVEALRWVQKNIKAFNGDPDKVTITGFSAGGASVHLHFMSPLTDGLFNNGISHSGVALNPWVMMENGEEKSHQIASFMNCPQENHRKLLLCLREKPAEDLVMLAKKFQPFLYNPFSPFGVSVEKTSATAFLSDHPFKLLQEGNFKKLPWLLSQTQDEGLYPAYEFYDDEILKSINDRWEEVAPFIFDYNGTSSDAKWKLEVSRKILKFYLEDREISKENFHYFLQAITDRLYHYGAHKSIQMQSAYSSSYFYYFRFVTNSGIGAELNRNGANLTDFLGISHSDDVFLIYNNPDSRGPAKIPYSTDEISVSRQLVNLYHNFALSDVAVYGNLTVNKVQSKSIEVLDIFSPNNYSMTLKNHELGHVKFWDDLNIRD